MRGPRRAWPGRKSLRKFLYTITGLILLAIAVLLILRLYGQELSELALVPREEFAAPEAMAAGAWDDPALWFSHPALPRADDPARYRPANDAERSLPVTPLVERGAPAPPFAVFFVHPTSYLDPSSWNAPLDDEPSQQRARQMLRGMASPFAAAAQIWAPRYRQATFGAFLTEAPAAGLALDAAHADIAAAFAAFLDGVDPALPIVLAGHSQGAYHVGRLLAERVAGTPLQGRVAMAYMIGWPVSAEHDLAALGLPACRAAADAGCIASWASFAEPADPGQFLARYAAIPGLDGAARGQSPILCLNPLTGAAGTAAPQSANLGTLVPEEDLSGGALVAGAVPARCDAETGLLLIGDPPELGPYVLPGNNYHVYDIPLFWANVEADVARRVAAFTASRP